MDFGSSFVYVGAEEEEVVTVHAEDEEDDDEDDEVPVHDDEDEVSTGIEANIQSLIAWVNIILGRKWFSTLSIFIKKITLHICR